MTFPISHIEWLEKSFFETVLGLGYSYCCYVIISTGVNCTIQFQHDTEQCLDQLVEYQCTVTGTGFTALTWRILEDDGTPFGNAVTYTSNGIGATITIGGVFAVEQLQPASPVVSTISFTVQSSINGYTIVCEDSINTLNNENFTINIPGIIMYNFINLQ